VCAPCLPYGNSYFLVARRTPALESVADPLARARNSAGSSYLLLEGKASSRMSFGIPAKVDLQTRTTDSQASAGEPSHRGAC
jgi:hypothetical protein